MKKILFIVLSISFLFAENNIIYFAKPIGKVKFPGFLTSNLDVYCIDGVQYVKDSDDQKGFMTVLFNKNGKLKTCK